jgi:hypothetical protein
MSEYIGKKVTLIREGNNELVYIDGTITDIKADGLLEITHRWGVCYDRIGSKTLSMKQGKKSG